MSTITRELAKLFRKITNSEIDAEGNAHVVLSPADSLLINNARIALASLEAEPVAWLWSNRKHPSEVTLVRPEDDEKAEAAQWSGWSCQALYASPTAQVSVPDFLEQFAEFMAAESIKSGDYPDGWQCKASNAAHEYSQNIRAAMLQGSDTELQRKASAYDALCEKYNVESLTDFVDWQRNHIAELEAAPPAPVGPGETAVMPDYPGYAMTQRECFQAGEERAAQTAWVACSERMPEDEQEVLTRNKMGHCFVSFFDEHSGLFFDRIDVAAACCIEHILVTHWQPLPAAPQQEVKS
ncbi:DUF551 domain-containing protein [Enterobacter hormaechei]|uniref:DUF551 domain-containing protein n=1 Tax=Enterobacter hormaechei TaxID=158836 RepID=UPI003351F8EE